MGWKGTVRSVGAIVRQAERLELASALKSVPLHYRIEVRTAALHLLDMCFKDGSSPMEIKATADGGVVFYWFPVPKNHLVYTSLEVFEDGDVVAAWTDGRHNDVWDLGTLPDAGLVAEALGALDAAFPQMTGSRGFAPSNC